MSFVESTRQSGLPIALNQPDWCLFCLQLQNSRFCTTMIDASNISTATERLDSMPNQGKCSERRYVLLSIEKSPVTNRQRLNCRSHASNNIAASSTIPNARAGAVYSPETKDETNTAKVK